MTTERDVELLERYTRAQAGLRARGTDAVAAVWDDLPDYNRGNVARYAALAGPMLDGVADAALTLAAAYLDARGIRTVGLDRTKVDRPPADDAFQRVWAGLARGEPWEQAVAAGRNRTRVAVNDVVMRAEDTANRAAGSAPGSGIVGWRRVPIGSTCSYCVLISTQRYRTADTARAPGHRQRGLLTCDCRVDPIIGNRDPGRVIGRSMLKEWKTAQGPDGGPAYFDVAADGGTIPTTRPDQPVDPGDAERLRRARRGNARELARAEAVAIRRQEEIVAARAAARAAGVGGPVDPELLARWDITEAQFNQGRALAKQVKADIRATARAEAAEVGGWLANNDLDVLTRPDRLRQRMSGRRTFVRDQSGYDFLEGLDDAELRQVRARMTDSGLYSPDLVAEQVRRKTSMDFSDDEALMWLTERWLHEDALRAVAAGRLPRYANASSIMPADFAEDGYNLERLFGVELDEAAGHVARVQADQARRFAEQALGAPEIGPAPWQMEYGDFVRDLEDVESILDVAQVAEGIVPTPAEEYARARIRELAPPDIDPTGTLSPIELYEQIRLTATTAGLLR